MNDKFMRLAINEAWKYQFLTYPNPAVGATVVLDNELLSIGVHKQAGKPHAEVNAIKEAFLKLHPKSTINQLTSSYDIHQYLIKNHNNCFINCDIYVTLEPCNHIGKTPSCASLIKNLKFKTVIIGSNDTNDEAKGGISTLQSSNIKCLKSKLFNETNNLLFPFQKWQKDKFIFFKLAMREDGSIDGGYITTKQSLKRVHHIRTLIDTLIIGGNTVRVDKPTLDTRFIENSSKNPNILIYSNNIIVDNSIPLFNIKNRKVTIDNSLNSIKNDNFIMVEGGFNLLKTLKNHIDILMIFVSHKQQTTSKFDFQSLGFKIIHTDKSNEDTILYLK
jgi:diaminohydroxyphosphoribosylaminopyrimidine deaminase/5-amino-6-(5-phosphoribosylamino)uracil reductase